MSFAHAMLHTYSGVTGRDLVNGHRVITATGKGVQETSAVAAKRLAKLVRFVPRSRPTSNGLNKTRPVIIFVKKM